MSAFKEAAVRLVDAQFSHFGRAGRYLTSEADEGVLVALRLSQPDERVTVGRVAGVVSTHMIAVRSSEVGQPEKDHLFLIDGEEGKYLVNEAPMQPDAHRLVWHCPVVRQ